MSVISIRPIIRFNNTHPVGTPSSLQENQSKIFAKTETILIGLKSGNVCYISLITKPLHFLQTNDEY